jgi:hypothetical protein
LSNLNQFEVVNVLPLPWHDALNRFMSAGEMRQTWTARFASWAQYVSGDKGGIRTWLAVGSVCVAVPARVMHTWKMDQFMDHASSVNTSESTHATMQAATDWAAVTASFAGLGATVALDSDSRLSSPNLAAAYRFLEDHPLKVPPSSSERRDLMDLADWASSVGAFCTVSASGPAASLGRGLLQPAFLAEKYGAYMERLLGNPFVQDQMLVNPGRWGSVIVLGHQLKNTASATSIPHEHTKRAHDFLDAFEEQSQLCSRDFRAAIKVGGLEEARSRLGVLVPGTEADPQFVYCTYTKQWPLAAAPPAPQQVASSPPFSE